MIWVGALTCALALRATLQGLQYNRTIDRLVDSANDFNRRIESLRELVPSVPAPDEAMSNLRTALYYLSDIDRPYERDKIARVLQAAGSVRDLA